MTLSNHQFEFAKDFNILLDFIIRVKKLKVTIKEVARPQEMQKMYYEQGLSHTLESNHLYGCAVDLIIFIDGKPCYNKDKLAEIGVFWENLNPLNRWGGFFNSFTDAPHFERNVT
jgi:D-alanyl-D-alanine dipeptidase